MAEDNDLNAEIAITILEDMGLIVERVEDGIQCVAKMEQMPAKSYDLILMDVQMPHMDGYKATETIRELSDEGKAHIPIVALKYFCPSSHNPIKFSSSLTKYKIPKGDLYVVL